MNWNREDFRTVPEVISLRSLQRKFNQISFWVSATVCRVADLPLRGGVIEFFISVAEECRKLKNFSAAMAVMSGLNNISISRMKRAWTEVLPEQMQLWDQLNAQMSTASNYKKYRTAIAELETGYIPFTGVLTRDITFIEEGNDYRVQQENGRTVLNVEKMMMVGTVLRDLDLAHRPIELPEADQSVLDFLEVDLKDVPDDADDILYDLSQKYEKKITTEEEWKKEKKRRKKRATELQIKSRLSGF